MEHIEKQSRTDFYDYCEKSGNTICGRHPIGVLLGAIEAHKKEPLETKFTHYSQSEKVTSADQSSVSYAACITVIS